RGASTRYRLSRSPPPKIAPKALTRQDRPASISKDLLGRPGKLIDKWSVGHAAFEPPLPPEPSL
ncbi:hypothetical protein PIB30_095671, partial [Stylosanthes scabra]|nr:hypothetical protein [Stylosanthes scabra]